MSRLHQIDARSIACKDTCVDQNDLVTIQKTMLEDMLAASGVPGDCLRINADSHGPEILQTRTHAL